MDVRGLRALICVLVVIGCVVVFVPSVAAATDVDSASVATQETFNETEALEDADEVHIDIFVQENGTATFAVDYRFENTSEGSWEELRDDVEENPEAYAAEEADGWNDILERGENETDREMELSNVSVSTETSSQPRDMGHVEFTFTWSSFAHVEPALIEAGNALAGFTLVDDTTLQISWPDTYSVREVDPTPDNPPEGSVFWDGDGTEFADDQPRLVLIENGQSTTGTVEADEEPAAPWLVVAGALALLGIGAAAGWWLKREPEQDGSPTSTVTSSTPETDAAAATGPGTGTQQTPPPELLSNEERVLRLLEQRGGRIKQQEVVSELDWTEAKTSQVVSSLREDGEIDVFRIGRENVLALPDEDGEDGDAE